jgi:hypothetical protein
MIKKGQRRCSTDYIPWNANRSALIWPPSARKSAAGVYPVGRPRSGAADAKKQSVYAFIQKRTGKRPGSVRNQPLLFVYTRTLFNNHDIRQAGYRNTEYKFYGERNLGVYVTKQAFNGDPVLQPTAVSYKNPSILFFFLQP